MNKLFFILFFFIVIIGCKKNPISSNLTNPSNLIDSIVWYQDSLAQPTLSVKFFYDEQQRVIEEDWISYGSPINDTEKRAYQYKASNLPNNEVFYTANSGIRGPWVYNQTSSFQYDALGRKM